MNVSQNFSKYWMYIAVILLFVAGVCWLIRSNRVCTNGNPVQQATEQLKQVERDQQSITAGIDNVEGTVNKSIAKIGDIKEKLCGAGEIIADCQRILAEVETRTVAR